MPELPEVEITCQGIRPVIIGKTVTHVTVRQRKLRWPVNPKMGKQLQGARIESVTRRGKYIVWETSQGGLLIHLGMSGTLSVAPRYQTYDKHDHVEICFSGGQCLRFRDPRRFGAVIWTTDSPLSHPRLKNLGLEPLESEFTGAFLYAQSRHKKVAVKPFIMNSSIVTGVGNIYASEALFLAGIHPLRQAGRISLTRYNRLAQTIKHVLLSAIEQGGTTLRDFVSAQNQKGYFQLKLQMYGRQGQACPECGQEIKKQVIGQRSSFYCAGCQH